MFLLAALAAFLTIHFSKGNDIKWKLVKFVGVLASTIPIIGLIQAYYASQKSRGYAIACACQAVAGVVTYALIRDVLRW